MSSAHLSFEQQALALQKALDIGLQHHAKGNFSKAKYIYEQVLKVDPNHAEVLHLLGVIAHQVGENGRAVELITKAIAIHPDYAEAHSNLGNALQDLGKLDKAITSHHKAIALNPNLAEAHYNLGITLLSLGKLDEAIASYRKALTRNPDYAEAHNNLGVVLKEQGKLVEAVSFYQKAIALAPDFAEAHCNLGNVLNNLGRLDEAIVSYREAVTRNPGYAEAHNNLGVVLKELGRLDEAVISYHEAISLDTSYAEAHINLGNTLHDLGNLNEAVVSYQKAIDIKPEHAEAYNHLSVTFKELERIDEAVVGYHKALNIKPGYANVHFNLGNLYQDLGDLEKSIASYQKALSIKPDFAEAHGNLGVTLHSQGKLMESAERLYSAININPDYSEAHTNLGNMLQDMGHLNEACIRFQKALDINPKFFTAFSNMYLSIPALCHDILTKQIEISFIEELIDALPTPPEPDILRLQLRSLTGGGTEEAWNNVVGNMPTIQSETIVNDNSITPPSIIRSDRSSPRKMVALLHFGRSGSGYLHSLLDDHPNISTLPGVYMSGFFGREVWDRISGKGFQEIPERFSSLYKVLFDARNPEKIPPAFISDTHNNKSVGEKEGFVKMGPNQDTPLTLGRGQFLENLGEVISGLEDINHGQFFDAIHHAYERTLGSDFSTKKLIFYHLHKIDPYSMANFVKYFPGAELLMIIRNPLQSCESWALKPLQSDKNNKYKAYQSIGNRISSMLMDFNIPAFQTQPSVAVRLEDIKEHPKETMRGLCAYLGIEETASLYNSTMQGLKWWGDPSSSLFGKTQTQYDEHTDPIRTKTGALFTAADQFILNTLFYPLSARFGYVEKNERAFKNNLQEIRPLIDIPLDFEQKLAEEFLPDYPELEMTDAFKSLHAVLVGLWHLLDEHGTYPYLMKALPIK
jgi:tetratricopeptide (TPR) repeat protein